VPELLAVDLDKTLVEAVAKHALHVEFNKACATVAHPQSILAASALFTVPGIRDGYTERKENLDFEQPT
jgi:hypothetical protein